MPVSHTAPRIAVSLAVKGAAVACARGNLPPAYIALVAAERPQRVRVTSTCGQWRVTPIRDSVALEIGFFGCECKFREIMGHFERYKYNSKYGLFSRCSG